ncbi:MAG: hypothetical protein JST54_12280 [Deltaproteobacteria bacterium]|nr:hypothetical protein [Deltaproteobacteria bacterium]
MPRNRALAVCLLVIAACTTTETAGEGPVADALEAVKAGGGTTHERALAGWYRYLAEGNAAQARELFGNSTDDLVSLAGQQELARRDLDLAARGRLAIRLATVGANDPLGRVGAHVMFDLMGQSPQLDAQLAEGAQGILKTKASPAVALSCRLVVARAAELRGDASWAARFAEAGAVGEYAVAGPLGALHVLDFAKVFPPEQKDALDERYATPVGEVHTRTIRYPTGDVRLTGEPERGDIFYFVSDFSAQGGDYVVETVGAAPHMLWVDGQKLITRQPESLEGLQHAASVPLTPGAHRLMLKLSRSDGGQVSVYVLRADGGAEDFKFHAASGPPPGAAPVVADDGTKPMPVTTRELFGELAPEVGKLTATYLSARDGLTRDIEGSKTLLAGVDPYPATAPMLELRAQATLSDHSLPDRTAKGRAGRDLEAATQQDGTDAAAWLLRAGQARDAEQFDDAKVAMSKADAAAPRSAMVSLNLGRLALARGLDALADQEAKRSIERFPGYCDGVELRYDLARRREAVAESDALIKELVACPDGLERQAELARARGDLAMAEKVELQRAERAPASWRTASELAQVYVSARRYPEAEKVIREQFPIWPRNADLHKQLADILTLQGNATGALDQKRAALALDGADLMLRRQLALAEGHDLLDNFAVDSKQVIADFEKAPKPEGLASAASAYVLDLAGVKVLPDGTQLERIHTIAQVIDQRGIPQLAEQHLPQGAVILRLATIKKDGRVLEPEALGDKEGVSLPDVQVGDYVDIEYLGATPPRSPAEPGWSSVPFYFRIAESPLFFSTYTVEAPAEGGVQVDAHNMDAPTPKKEGDHFVVHHEAHQVPLFIPEPNSPGGNEYLPFMQAGTGASAIDALWPFADSIVGRDAPTLEVAQFAHAAAKDAVGIEAVRALFTAVSDKIKGEANDINDRAALTLARERGSRLWLLKGALKALGISSRIALVRPLAADPSTYLFPNTDLYTYPVLKVDLPDQPSLWLDPSVRYGPFGTLPDQVAGDREAVILPEPGEVLQLVKTPPAPPDAPKQVKLHLTLDAQGNVVGEGSEVYAGYEAAYLRQALERFDELQRKQAVEVALSRSFRGAALETLTVDTQQACGAPLTLNYKFTSPHFARAETGKLVLATPIFPLSLGQRFIALAQRTTPLLIGGNESSQSEVRIDLPTGFKATVLGDPANIQTPFGAYKRAARVEQNTLVLDEVSTLNQGRVFPKAYPEFVKFTAAVDQAQQQQMELAQ